MKIKKQLVKSRAKTFAGTNPRRFITIHETANTSKGADAQAHANLQSRGFSASWHYTVDDTQAIQSFPHTVRCWHAGDGRGHGNMSSIGIEICVNSDGNYGKAVANAAELVRKIMAEENIPLANVVQHNHWSGKNCPTNLRKGSKWREFLSQIAQTAAPSKPTAPKPAPSKPGTKSVSEMASEVIAGKHGNGHANRRRSLGIDAATYAKVRAEVNRRAGGSGSGGSVSKPAPSRTIAAMAKEVIDGKHGNGHANRQKSLGISASEYAKVRAEVNRLAKKPTSKPKKTVSQMATEVIAGKHGTGHTSRRKSLGINAAQYAQVRAEVNRRLK